ncbi:hypothetical protein PQX77_015516 [Marasmius sp. AFHP31]|nr:hypothetical protein PQX77_015516 [Marasmius sp. AFHP31]
MPFTKPTPMPPSSSSSGTTTTTTTTSSSSLLFTPPRASPPTTTNGTSKSKILPRALTIPHIFRSSASNSLPPPSPASPRASTMMTRRFSNLRRLSFPKPVPVPVPVPLPSPPIAVQTGSTTTPNNNTATVYRPMKNESRCLQHIARGIYVAFQDDDFPVPLPRTHTPRTEELLTDSGHPFTHTISIVRASDTLSPPLITTSTSTSTHHKHTKTTMTLSTLPRPHDQYEYQMDVLARDPELTRITREMAEVYLDASYFTPERTFTSGDNGVARLGLKQMRAARDFILRGTGAGTGSGSGLGRGEEVKGGKGEEEERRVLITAPRDHRTDIMSIVVCILSDCTGSCPAEVVNGIDRQRGVMPVWKGCISRVGVEYIQEVC